MERVDMQTGQEESAHIPLVSKTEVILDATDINEIYSNAISRIPETMANFQMRVSNWRFMATTTQRRSRLQHGYCIGVSRRSAQATVGKGLAQGPYMAARAGVEPGPSG